MHPENSKLSQLYGKIEPIIIDDDAWIGAGAIIVVGVRVHKCSIGGGGCCYEGCSSNTVVAGVPARPIKTVAGVERSLRIRGKYWSQMADLLRFGDRPFVWREGV